MARCLGLSGSSGRGVGLGGGVAGGGAAGRVGWKGVVGRGGAGGGRCGAGKGSEPSQMLRQRARECAPWPQPGHRCSRWQWRPCVHWDLTWKSLQNSTPLGGSGHCAVGMRGSGP